MRQVLKKQDSDAGRNSTSRNLMEFGKMQEGRRNEGGGEELLMVDQPPPWWRSAWGAIDTGERSPDEGKRRGKKAAGGHEQGEGLVRGLRVRAQRRSLQGGDGYHEVRRRSGLCHEDGLRGERPLAGALDGEDLVGVTKAATGTRLGPADRAAPRHRQLELCEREIAAGGRELACLRKQATSSSSSLGESVGHRRAMADATDDALPASPLAPFTWAECTKLGPAGVAEDVGTWLEDTWEGICAAPPEESGYLGGTWRRGEGGPPDRMTALQQLEEAAKPELDVVRTSGLHCAVALVIWVHQTAISFKPNMNISAAGQKSTSSSEDLFINMIKAASLAQHICRDVCNLAFAQFASKEHGLKDVSVFARKTAEEPRKHAASMKEYVNIQQRHGKPHPQCRAESSTRAGDWVQARRRRHDACAGWQAERPNLRSRPRPQEAEDR